MATKNELDKLKSDWYRDPIWDIYETEGFEEHQEELVAYQKQCEQAWEEEALQRESDLKKEAEKLGLVGLYKLLLKQEEELKELREKVNNDH